MAYSFDGVATHPDRRLDSKHFATRCYSDDELCKFLDICADNCVPVSNVAAIGDDVYIVIYRWKQYINTRGDNMK